MENMAKPRNFETPEELWEAFEEYKQDLKKQESEWVKVYFVGKNSERKEEPQKLPYTFEGFKRFCTKKYGCVHQYFENKSDYKEYATVCSQIKDEIRENQIIGGMLGFFNPSITQRLNGLSDRKDVDVNSIKIGVDYEEMKEVYI
jgi:DNA-packaging protein gp3